MSSTLPPVPRDATPGEEQIAINVGTSSRHQAMVGGEFITMRSAEIASFTIADSDCSRAPKNAEDLHDGFPKDFEHAELYPLDRGRTQHLPTMFGQFPFNQDHKKPLPQTLPNLRFGLRCESLVPRHRRQRSCDGDLQTLCGNLETLPGV